MKKIFTAIFGLCIASVSFAQNNYINDIDNNLYHLQKVGNTLWAYENLNVTHFRNGDSILEIKTQSEWRNTIENKIAL